MLSITRTSIRLLATTGALLLALAACGEDDNDTSSSGAGSTTTTTGVGGGGGDGGNGDGGNGGNGGDDGSGGDGGNGDGGNGGGGGNGDGGSGGGGGNGDGGNGGGGEGGAAPEAATWSDVEPVLRARCATCHGINPPAGGFALTYASAMTNADHPACKAERLTRGACALKLVLSGDMPANAGCKGDPAQDAGKPACLKAEELETLRSWVEGGLAE